jgi:hypothetical protein
MQEGISQFLTQNLVYLCVFNSITNQIKVWNSS